MKIRLTTLLIGATVLSTYGQINKSDLLGEWVCENNEGSYYRSKYITLYGDSTFQDRSNQCNFIEWSIKLDRFMFANINKCTDDGLTRMSMSLFKYGINVKKRAGRKTIIELTKGEEVYETFKVIEFSKQGTKRHSQNPRILKLKRVRNNALQRL